MSSAAATGAGGGAPSGADDRVYCAVVAGASVEDVRRAIERSCSSVAVNQAGRDGATPLRAALRLQRHDLLCVLLENGAEAGDSDWFAAVCWCVREIDLAGLRRLLKRGVSVNTTDNYGFTPLMTACSCLDDRPDRRDLTLEIFRRSSAETRRAVSNGGWSAVDVLLYRVRVSSEIWQVQLIGELLAAGTSVLPKHRARVLPFAAAHAARREAELAALPPLAHDWRAHETFVGLSLDVRELREAERAVQERRARLEALERELGSESDDENESESEEDEDDEAARSTGSGK